MAIRGDKKLPFAARREVLLGYIETLTKYMEGKTYDDFANDDVLITHGVAKVMEQVGELLFPMSGHASAGLARKFYESRHMNVHEYSTMSLEDVWKMMGNLDQLRDEVLEREFPPPDQQRPARPPPDRGLSR